MFALHLCFLNGTALSKSQATRIAERIKSEPRLKIHELSAADLTPVKEALVN